MRSKILRSLALTCGFVFIGSSSFAQQPSDAAAIRAEVTRLRQELDALETRLAAIEGGASAAPAPAPVAAPSQAAVPEGAALPVYGTVGGAVSGAKVFNPDMAVIGDFLGAGGSNKVAPSPALEMHESEAAFQAVVDPYARADFFISFGEQGVSVEEGFITLTSLPGGWLTKVGKMRAAFGKVNSLHNHVLPWTDRPIVTNNLVGGEDGINDAGVSVARLIPIPGLFLEATGQMFRGDSGANLFKTSKRGDLTYLGHLRAYQDLSEGTNLDLGASYARGHNRAGIVNDIDVGRFTTQLFGVDATLRYKPLRRSIYHSFVGRTEVIWSRRQQINGEQRAFGYYVSGDYQFARRWFVGGRYDRSDRADDASLFDKGGSVVLTYWPSEFSQLRGQYRRTNYADGPIANEILFQFQFSIGAHGAHPF
jgi:hypothetical protein